MPITLADTAQIATGVRLWLQNESPVLIAERFLPFPQKTTRLVDAMSVKELLT